MENKIKLILTTFSKMDDARLLCEKLVEADLSPCIQLIPKIISIYKWEEKLNEDSEILALIKLDGNNEERIFNFLYKNHPYETPEIISINAEILNKEYQDWFFSKKQ